MSKLVKFDPHQVGSLLEDLNVSERDDVTLRIRGGVVRTHVKYSSGGVHSATTMLGGKFRQLTAFDPNELSAAERRKIVSQLHRDGHRQTAIANLLGVAQATISLDIKKLRAHR